MMAHLCAILLLLLLCPSLLNLTPWSWSVHPLFVAFMLRQPLQTASLTTIPSIQGDSCELILVLYTCLLLSRHDLD